MVVFVVNMGNIVVIIYFFVVNIAIFGANRIHIVVIYFPDQLFIKKQGESNGKK